MDLKTKIREIPNFPKAGIAFKDITPLLQDPIAFRYAMNQFVERYQDQGIDQVVCVESRGFLLAPVLAYALGAGLVLVRKKGKLPFNTISHSYLLEYGQDTLEVHADALTPGARVVIIDDLLATGGTAGAASQLLSKIGAHIVEIAFLIELSFLHGREKLRDFQVYSQITFP